MFTRGFKAKANIYGSTSALRTLAAFTLRVTSALGLVRIGRQSRPF